MSAVPGPVANLAEVMSTYSAPWALCGGWAVDAWLGRVTRDHGDVDFAVFDQPVLFEHLNGWQMIGHEEANPGQAGAELWDGRPLVPPAHLHARSPEASGPLPERFDKAGSRILFPEDGFVFDIQLCERSNQDWVLNWKSRIAKPLAGCIRESGWGLPTVGPEVILFFKATLYVGTKNHLRPRDEGDFVTLLPQLSSAHRDWLGTAISTVLPGHPWLSKL
jgi:hypothetical protein